MWLVVVNHLRSKKRKVRQGPSPSPSPFFFSEFGGGELDVDEFYLSCVFVVFGSINKILN